MTKEGGMSNAWLNIRCGLQHLIIGEEWLFGVRVSRNDYHMNNPKRFEIHGLRLFGLVIR